MRIDATLVCLGKTASLGIGEVHRAPGASRAGTGALMLSTDNNDTWESAGAADGKGHALSASRAAWVLGLSP